MALHVARWAERTLGEHEPPLTVAQYLVLEALAHGVDAPGALARNAGVSSAAVSQLLRELERAALVERSLAPEDRRRHRLALTPAGRAVYASATELVAQRLAGPLGRLPPPDVGRLAEALIGVAEAVAAAPPPPPRPRPRRHPPP